MIEDIIEKERKLKKVTLEYSNGDKEYIEGKDSEIWLKALKIALTTDIVHGGEAQKLLEKIIWKKS